MDILKNGALWLFGTVGRGVVDDEDGFTAIDVRDALAEIGKRDVTVHINSGGGWSDEGIAIHSQLSAHPGKVTVIVEGVAASAASVLAMAGQEIVVRLGAYLMIHEATGFTIGNVKDHRKMIEALETVNRSMVDIYTAKTKRPRREIEAELRAETWLDSTSAVARRYADRVDAGGIAHKPAVFAWGGYNKAPTKIAATAETARFAPAFEAAMVAASRARDEAAIEDLIRKFWPGRRHDPEAQKALAVLKESHPAAVDRALSNVVSWRRVVDRQNA